MQVASGAEIAYVLISLVPLAFFAYCTLYLWRLLLASILVRSRVAALTPPVDSAPEPSATVMESSLATTRFVLLIPAHNEELVLAPALDSLAAMDYPHSLVTLVVIADNCTDCTAEIARAHGATVLERFNKELIGKGYALEWALNRLRDESFAEFDAIVILDADTKPSRNLLQAFDAGLKAGMPVMQARYEVLNANESWRTRLMACALALAHVVKPLGREHLSLSDGLKGNGMCFAAQVVEAVPWSGESITEDIEYTLRLCRAGYRVAFLPNAAVWAQMPTTGAQATSQRKRWEGGRYQLLFKVAPHLLAEGIQSRNRLIRDRAVELIIPPFAELFAFPTLMLGVSLALAVMAGWHWATWFAGIWASILILQAGYLMLGMWVARVPAQVALSALYAPFYIIWKFSVYAAMVVTRSAGGWKRTERHKL